MKDGLQGQPFHVCELPKLALGLRGLGWPCKRGTKTASCCPIVLLQTFAELMVYKILLMSSEIIYDILLRMEALASNNSYMIKKGYRPGAADPPPWGGHVATYQDVDKGDVAQYGGFWCPGETPFAIFDRY